MTSHAHDVLPPSYKQTSCQHSKFPFNRTNFVLLFLIEYVDLLPSLKVRILSMFVRKFLRYFNFQTSFVTIFNLQYFTYS